jgi:cell division septal protein FtsQ
MKVSAPSDKRFRRAHVKPGRKRGRRRRSLRVLRFAVLAAVTFLAGYRAVVFLDQTNLLKVAYINVRDNSRLSTDEVIALLDGLKGHHILTLDLAEWRKRLLRSSWIEDAAVRRVLPSTVEVTIVERRPLGISRIGDRLYLVDPAGVVIDEYGPAYREIDLPIIRGLAGPGETQEFAVNVERAELAARVLSSLSRPDIADRISEVDVTDPYSAAVILEGDPAIIKLGREDFLERLQSYLELSAALRERVPDIDYVDLRFDQRVYVRPVEAGRGR